MFPFLVDFAALPPEENSARLSMGPGPAEMESTAAAYAAIADGFHTAAAGSDGTMGEMEVVWQGHAADQAQRAFRNHANWLRTEGDAAAITAAIATEVAMANGAALATMPTVPEIEAVQTEILAASAASTDSMGLGVAALVFWEGVYLFQWGRAATTMAAYAATTAAAVARLPPPSEAPPIVAGPPGSVPPVPSGMDPGGPVGKSGGGHPAGTGSDGSGPPDSPGDPPGNGGGSQPGGGDPGNPGDPGQPGQPGNPGGDPGNSGQPGGEQPGPTPGSPGQQPISELPAMPTDGYDGGDTSLPPESGLLGAAPDSPTLAGLNGGLGSMVALGMVPGGFGAMPGSMTGFRMPTNWSTMPTRAFGMGTGTPAAQPVPQRTAPRGVTAPRARQRRRQDERKPAKAFAPGESQDVPILEEPPAIGVIEYLDGDGRQESASEQILALGELTYDPDSDPILESATPIRPR